MIKTNNIVPLSRHHMFQIFSSFTFEHLEMPIASSPHHDLSHQVMRRHPTHPGTTRRGGWRCDDFGRLLRRGCGGGKDGRSPWGIKQGNSYNMHVFPENCGRKCGRNGQIMANQQVGLMICRVFWVNYCSS